jgi:methylated-DNA-protein-cysteine methyltransferase-like protein
VLNPLGRPRRKVAAAASQAAVKTDAVPCRRNEAVWAVVSLIPAGRVATYGQIAALAGIEGPSGARQVGYALSALPPGIDVPWHRVINRTGRVSPRKHGTRDEMQYALLMQEGVCGDDAGHIDLKTYRWAAGG